MEPTHIEGNILDQAYVRDESGLLKITAEIQTKYYTDHRAIAMVVKHGKKKKVVYLFVCLKLF